MTSGQVGPPTPVRVRPTASVVIPAHNEAAVIARLLTSLIRPGRGRTDLEVVVVCNGCTDDTAAVVRAGFPQVRVLETSVASKNVALDLGDRTAHHFPRAYVDADVVLGQRDLEALLEALTCPGILAVAPTRALQLNRASWPVRAYYRVWSELPAVQHGLYGRGVLVVSAEGHARLGRRVDTTGDDLALHHAFEESERRVASGAGCRIWVPDRLADLVRRRARAAYGNTEFARGNASTATTGSSLRAVARLARARPRRAPDVLIFLFVTAAARVRAGRMARTHRPVAWLRDDSSRAVRNP